MKYNYILFLIIRIKSETHKKIKILYINIRFFKLCHRNAFHAKILYQYENLCYSN